MKQKNKSYVSCASSCFGQFFNSTFTIFIVYSFIGTITILVYKHISETDWANDIKSNRLFTSPFSSHELGSMHRNSTLVYPKDVLISTRFDASFLGPYKHVLSYHPGNRMWETIIFAAGPIFQCLRPVEQNIITRVLVQDIMMDEGRFLLQNSIGDWTILSVLDAEVYTKDILSLYGNNLLKSLVIEASYLLSKANHGHLRKTVMSKKYNSLVINVLMNNIRIHFDASLFNDQQKVKGLFIRRSKKRT